MKRKNLFNMLIALVMSAGIIMLSACGGGQQAKDKKGEAAGGEILILYPNWAEGIAFTNLAMVALQDKGYDVTIKPIEPGPIYASLAKGDADLFFDAWLPHTHADYWEKYGDKLVKLGESFSNGTTGLVVPQYVTIDSISQINDQAKKFDDKIIGIGSGAGIHRNTEKAIEAYGLEVDQITSSGPAMMASLQKAYAKQDWVVLTGWKPHYMWADYDLKYLKDPKNVYPKDVCAILSRTGFEEDFPKVAKFCGNFNLEERELYDLMDEIENAESPDLAAKAWYQTHEVMVESWWPKSE